MDKNIFSLKNEQSSFFVYKPFDLDNPDFIMVIAHGLAEHAERYYKLCEFMYNHNVLSFAIFHPGHGKYTLEPGVWPEKGFFVSINNMDTLIDYVKTKFPSKKIVLFGHSMGSFLSLGYIEKHGEKLDLCILSGTNDAQPKSLSSAGTFISSLICKISGRNKPSKLLNNMSFGSFNKSFSPNRTEFDWLSKDEKEVNKYVEDPLCGFIPSAGLFRDLLEGLTQIYKPEAIEKIPKALPVHILGGSNDPVGNFGKGLEALQKRLLKHHINHVTLKIYENNRHECINETNSSVVMSDVYVICQDTML
ncbi:MAG: alpha/beta fold hydrolase [Clostridia bacterium]|nr:alpha/beta fold hydrolase [Clostridia bacterium]